MRKKTGKYRNSRYSRNSQNSRYGKNSRYNKNRRFNRNSRGRAGRLLAGGLLLLILAAAAAVLFPESFSRTGRLHLPAGEDTFSVSSCMADPDSIPDHTGADFVSLNGGMPNFNEYDLLHMEGETYSGLDRLGRCGPAAARLDRTMMPTEERGEIGEIKPTGWVQEKYPGIVDSEPPFLYNRCHLIAHAMTGQNANPENLITGTRHMNKEGMLPFEKEVLRYLDDSDNHVLYRVTPFFRGDELVARGVEMEAYSVEDHGRGVCFHVFVFNIQPGITIDYRTGCSFSEEHKF